MLAMFTAYEPRRNEFRAILFFGSEPVKSWFGPLEVRNQRPFKKVSFLFSVMQYLSYT